MVQGQTRPSTVAKKQTMQKNEVIIKGGNCRATNTTNSTKQSESNNGVDSKMVNKSLISNNSEISKVSKNETNRK